MHSLSLPCINMGFNGDRNSTAEVIWLLRKNVMQSVHFILTQNTNSAAVSSVCSYMHPSQPTLYGCSQALKSETERDFSEGKR